MCFEHPALSIWRVHQAGYGGGDRDGRGEGSGSREFAAVGEAALIVRPVFSVEVMDISSGAVAFLEAVSSGQTLEVAAAAALEVTPDVEFGPMLRRLLSAGAFAGVVAP